MRFAINGERIRVRLLHHLTASARQRRLWQQRTLVTNHREYAMPFKNDPRIAELEKKIREHLDEIKATLRLFQSEKSRKIERERKKK
jgi:hypothetical protein